MHATPNRIATLVTQIQQDFLDAPALTLTLSDAPARFGIDTGTCRALLDFLVEAQVLRNRRGAYVRHFPTRVSRRAA